MDLNILIQPFQLNHHCYAYDEFHKIQSFEGCELQLGGHFGKDTKSLCGVELVAVHNNERNACKAPNVTPANV